MAVFTGTHTTGDLSGEREDLQDAIFDISPLDTPFVSMCDRKSASAITYEWQTDALADATSDNAQNEGEDHTTVETATSTVKVGNTMQISDKTVAISGTAEAIDKAGRKSELARQIAKKGKELRRDMESIVLSNNTPSATDPRVMAPLRAWLQTNTSLGAGGSDSGHASGVPSSAATDGTDRNFTEALSKTVIQSCWTEGGEPEYILVNAYNKTYVSENHTGIATRNVDLVAAAKEPHVAIASIDFYVSDFGTLKVVPNRFQRGRDAWYIDPEYVCLRFLRNMQTEKLAKTGDADKRLMLVEWTLQVKNEAALGLVADLTAA